MDFYTDGDIHKNETENKKMNLYKLKIKLLTNKYYNDKSNVQIDIYKTFKKAIKKLKQIEKIYSNSNIEYMIYRSTSKPAFLWQEKFVNSYRFFCTMLGIIDGYLDKINRDIDFELKFVDKRINKFDPKNNMSLKSLLEAKERFLRYRDMVTYDYKEYNSSHELELMSVAIKNYPSHQYFKDCYEDIKKNFYQLNLQVELINAYNKGYTSVGKIKFNEVFEKYRELFEELLNFKKQISLNEDKIKTKKRV